MAFFKLKDKNIYYEIHGEGKPLLVLNGIMMSHLSWGKLLPEMSRGNKVILFDFLDQGKSDKMETAYKQDDQVEVVKGLMDYLGLEKANIFGISYGGEVAMQFAIKYGQRVDKLLLFNTTSYTNPWLRDIGRSWVAVANTGDPESFYNVTIPIIYSPKFYTENIKWMEDRRNALYPVFNDEFLQAMIRLIHSAEGYDIRARLKDVIADTLVVSGELDYLTPIMEQKFIHEQIKGSKYVMINQCGHASMYEKPEEFISLINGFLSIENQIKII